MPVDWKNLYKVRLASSDKAMDKHDVVKLLLVRKILQKYKRKDWIKIYTEFELDNGLKPDVYFEHTKDKSVIIYEIQKDYSAEWLKEKTEQYKKYEVYNFTVDFIPIELDTFTDDINEISNKLDEYIF